MAPLAARLAGDVVAHAHTVTAESKDFPRMSAGRLVTTSHHKLIRGQPKDVAGLKGWLSVEIHGKFYEDRPRGTPPLGGGELAQKG